VASRSAGVRTPRAARFPATAKAAAAAAAAAATAAAEEEEEDEGEDAEDEKEENENWDAKAEGPPAQDRAGVEGGYWLVVNDENKVEGVERAS
jgi:hypothetical protein